MVRYLLRITLLCSGLVSGIVGSPSRRPAGSLSPRQDSYYAITGVTTGGVQSRLEIRDLQKQTEQWNLLLLSLQALYAVSQDNKLSFYQVAGIHGQPWISWDGVDSIPDQDTMGYCPHSSNLFGSWHRPYLLLFEQLLHEQAVKIATQFPAGDTQTKYIDAANRLRWPYWDWAMPLASGDPIIPASVSATTIAVTYPNGTKANIANPLYSYKFHPLDNTQITGDPYNIWKETLRWPNSKKSTAKTQQSAAESAVMNEYSNLRSGVYDLLANYQAYYEFTTTGSDLGFNSLEAIHGVIHNQVGGGTVAAGHMTYVPWAAFEPIFWLHHCNVDRQVAIFQYLYPDNWVLPEQNDATWTIPDKSIQDVDSPLEPFHVNTNGDFFTSRSVQSTTDWGYTYPELFGSPKNATVRKVINGLYGPTSSSASVKSAFKAESSSDSLAENGANDSPLPRVYLARLKIPITAEPRKVTISIDSDYAGSGATLATGPGASNRNHTSTASVNLMELLSKKINEGTLASLDQDQVVPFLKKALAWKLETPSVQPSQEEVQSIRVTLISTEVKLPATPSDFPEWVGGFVEELEFGSV